MADRPLDHQLPNGEVEQRHLGQLWMRAQDHDLAARANRPEGRADGLPRRRPSRTRRPHRCRRRCSRGRAALAPAASASSREPPTATDGDDLRRTRADGGLDDAQAQRADAHDRDPALRAHIDLVDGVQGDREGFHEDCPIELDVVADRGRTGCRSTTRKSAMPPSALMPRATSRRQRLAWPLTACPTATAGQQRPGCDPRPERPPRPSAPASTTTMPTISWPRVTGADAAADGMRFDGHGRWAVTYLVDVGAADACPLDADQAPGRADGGHRHVIEAHVAPGVPADPPSSLGRQPRSACRSHRIVDELLRDAVVDTRRRAPAGPAGRPSRRSPGAPRAASGTGWRCRCAGSARQGWAAAGRTGARGTARSPSR